MQPCGLQCRYERSDFTAQELHEHHADNGDRHGHGANDFYSVAFFGDQGESGQGPDKAQQHFVDAGEWGMAGFVPAMRHGSCVGHQAGPCRERSELDVRLGAGDAEAEIERACASIED